MASRRIALPGQALHPDAVPDQEMIERAMHRLEEGAMTGKKSASGNCAAAA